MPISQIMLLQMKLVRPGDGRFVVITGSARSIERAAAARLGIEPWHEDAEPGTRGTLQALGSNSKTLKPGIRGTVLAVCGAHTSGSTVTIPQCFAK